MKEEDDAKSHDDDFMPVVSFLGVKTATVTLKWSRTVPAFQGPVCPRHGQMECASVARWSCCTKACRAAAVRSGEHWRCAKCVPGEANSLRHICFGCHPRLGKAVHGESISSLAPFTAVIDDKGCVKKQHEEEVRLGDIPFRAEAHRIMHHLDVCRARGQNIKSTITAFVQAQTHLQKLSFSVGDHVIFRTKRYVHLFCTRCYILFTLSPCVIYANLRCALSVVSQVSQHE